VHLIFFGIVRGERERKHKEDNVVNSIHNFEALKMTGFTILNIGFFI